MATIPNDLTNAPQPMQSVSARVLLVDDNDVNTAILSEYLGYKGYEVIVAQDGQESLDFAIEVHPDVILMDIQMPAMDGLEAIRCLRALPEFALCLIIALTALAMRGDQKRCLAAGTNDYITKPVSITTRRRTCDPRRPRSAQRIGQVDPRFSGFGWQNVP